MHFVSQLKSFACSKPLICQSCARKVPCLLGGGSPPPASFLKPRQVSVTSAGLPRSTFPCCSAVVLRTSNRAQCESVVRGATN